MNSQITKKRIKDVLNVDSIDSTQADFLATHVPFRKITVTNDLSGQPISEYISEEEIFSKYFANSDMYDRHQLIVVDGSSGSGKSHFIRWIHAKLTAPENQKDVILLIRRSDNTLKGTIKQFLQNEEVKNLKNKDIYERLVKANKNISEERFKYEIYHKFLVEIAADKTDEYLEQKYKKNLKELLSSSEFEERMLMSGGPVDRIYSKIASETFGNNEDVLPEFDITDFILDVDFNLKLNKNASKRAKMMANKLLPDFETKMFDDNDCNPKLVTDYMNSKVETVIQSCAGIEQGDFKQIFKEIRQELFLQGKNLVLLIEDITSCTGINRDLLDALIVNHAGSNSEDHMCRLWSVIGTTEQYFKTFRDNYLDRISTKITIEDGAIGNTPDDLVQFVAKYLNVMSLDEEQVNTWWKDGALDEEYPVHNDTENAKWETYDYNGKKLSLYPLSKMAIINLYNNMEVDKTPRYILRKIIEPSVENILDDKSHFPKYLKGKLNGLNYGVEGRIRSIISNLPIGDDKDDYRDRVLALVRYWGNGILEPKGSKNNNIGGIGYNVFKEFSLNMFAEKVMGVSGAQADDYEETFQEEQKEEKQEASVKVDESPKEKEVKEIHNKDFEDFIRILYDWHYEKKMLLKARPVRDEICRFIFATIEWQREGVPLSSVQMVEKSSLNLISIERQDRAIEKGLYLLEDTEETYQLLMCFGKWLHLGKSSWKYEGATSDIRYATTWLYKNKAVFVEIVKGIQDDEIYPSYLKCAIVAEVYRSILNGEVTKLTELNVDLLMKNSNDKKMMNCKGHVDSWIETLENIIYPYDKVKDNLNTIQSYFNLIQGKNKNAKRKIIKATELDVVFKTIKKELFQLNDKDFVEENIKERNISKQYVEKILSRLEKVAHDEIVAAKLAYKKVNEYFDFPEGIDIESEDIKELLNEAQDFYKDAETNGVNISIRSDVVVDMKKKTNLITQSLHILNENYNGKSVLEVLLAFSQNPMKIVNDFINLLDNIKSDMEKVYSDLEQEKNKLTRSGNWSADVDPRFEEYQKEFVEIIQLLEV